MVGVISYFVGMFIGGFVYFAILIAPLFDQMQISHPSEVSMLVKACEETIPRNKKCRVDWHVVVDSDLDLNN